MDGALEQFLCRRTVEGKNKGCGGQEQGLLLCEFIFDLLVLLPIAGARQRGYASGQRARAFRGSIDDF
jgi:hypothetical protein